MRVASVVFSGSRFIFWALSPVLLFSAVVIPLAIDRWTAAKVVLVGAWELGCVLAILGLHNPRRFWWAARAVTGLIFAAYVWYVVSAYLS